MDKNISFFLDGKKVTAQSGETILQVAKRNGVSIPTLCHSTKISHTTSCFVCMVKDSKRNVFLPSCATVPAEDMSIESSTDEVFKMRKAALELLLSEHTGDCEAPCTISCPAHANVEEYVREGRKGNFLESLKIIKERIPLPLSIGRVCPRFCEKDCRKNIESKPVAINEFKRLAADLHYEQYMEDCPALGDKKVAIVGGGPAGLSSAYFLRLNGISSVIYEAMPQLGGMLRYGIPEYRLPKDMLNKEIDHFGKMGGISWQCNIKVGKDIDIDTLKKNHDAVIVTIGCWSPASMRCQGEELASDGIAWLRELSKNNWIAPNPGKTIVIGGGNTAMDCVRSAVRLGSKEVSCFYRRTAAQMPAEQLEVDEAKQEGVIFEYLVAPVGLKKKGDKLVLSCIRMELGEPDASGRRRPVPVEGSEFEVEADTVIASIGQKTNAPEGLKINRYGDIDIAGDDMNMDDIVFAAGDCVTGAATVVEAVAAARNAALSIVSLFSGEKFEPEKTINVSRGHFSHMLKDDVVFLKEVSEKNRLELEHISMEHRRTTFKEVTLTASQKVVKEEGNRCYECSCTAKKECKLKLHSEEYDASPTAILGEKVLEKVDIRHPSIIHDPNKCIKCGICIKVCQEVIGKTLLGYKQRGFSSKVGPAFLKALPDSCKDCMACVVECPVGALDSRIKL